MGKDKPHDAIKTKYYWPNMYKNWYQYVIPVCNLSDKKTKKGQPSSIGNRCSSLQLGIDVSGPYSKTLSGNKYIIGFVHWYSGWPEAFSVPDKTAEIVVHLLLEEIIPSLAHLCKQLLIMAVKLLTG